MARNLLLQEQTGRNVLYLVTSLPLGIGYLCILVIGVSFSTLVIVLIGIPILLLFLSIWWKLAAFERRYTMQALQVDIPPMAPPARSRANRIQRIQAHLSQAVTWKSLAYLFLKFPFGLLSFYVVIAIPILILLLSIATFLIGFLIAPFVYLYYLLAKGDVDAQSVKRYMALSLTGYGLALTPLYLFNVLARLWGDFARVMLGMSDQSLRLAQATALAEQEHAKAERAEKSRSELIINVSHELRTPVASIRGHIESLMLACDESANRVPEPETLRTYLNIVHRESIRLGALFDDLLSVARAETQELRVQIGSVAVGEVIEEVYQTLMPLARRERQITLIRQVTPGLPPAQADRQRLLQVLLNLVRNAITYTPDGGIVSLSLQRADATSLMLTVSDTGIGIPPEDQERIFERFYRTDASRARTSGGFGLGLAIVRDFVIAMGGTITVESVVGEGSCFRVCLRTVEAPAP